MVITYSQVGRRLYGVGSQRDDVGLGITASEVVIGSCDLSSNTN